MSHDTGAAQAAVEQSREQPYRAERPATRKRRHHLYAALCWSAMRSVGMAWQPHALLMPGCTTAVTCSCSGSRHRNSLQLAASHSAAEQQPPWSPLAAIGSASTGSAAPGVSLWYATAAGDTAAATKGAASCTSKRQSEDSTHSPSAGPLLCTRQSEDNTLSLTHPLHGPITNSRT